MQERKEKGPLDGLLEFPGGKLEVDETPKECALREFEEESKVKLLQTEQFKMVTHHYEDRSVCLFVHFSNGQGINPKNGEWFDFNFDTKSLDYKDKLPEVNFEIIDDLLGYIKKHYDAGFLENIWARTL
jgi:mutator protein MutT